MAIKIQGNTVIDVGRTITANTATFVGNGFVKLPSGATAQRPNLSESGMIRYNTDLNIFESYSNAWSNISFTPIPIKTGFDYTQLSNILAVGQSYQFELTDFDLETTYNISATGATVSRNIDIITYTPTSVGTGELVINGLYFFFNQSSNLESVYTNPGTYSWTAPANVTSVSVVAVGAGGGSLGNDGAGGGGLGWKNNITVVPGQSYTVVVGGGGQINTTLELGTGGNSYFIDTSTVAGLGGAQGNNSVNAAGGGYVGDGGGNGGNGGIGVFDGAGGGGAGGYSGNGGNGWTDALNTGTDGSGGGGGGGGRAGGAAWNGGGVGIYGEGANGEYTGGHGTGGSGGADGSSATGGAYGGGGGGGDGGSFSRGAVGGNGAVRIVWGIGPSGSRAFPSTNVGAL